MNREEKSAVRKHNIQLIPVNPVKSKEKADKGFTLQIVLESYKGTELRKMWGLTCLLFNH